jgi:polyisoprenoid-binding protein YceI
MRPTVVAPFLLASGLVFAGVQSTNLIDFDLKDPKGVTGMSIAIDAPLEPIRGFAGGISGSVRYNVSDPAKSTGKLVLDSSTVQLISPSMTAAMHQPWCLDVKKYPTIEFNVTKVEKVKKEKGGKINARISGDFTFHGVTKPLSVDATILHMPGKLKARGGVEKDGDLLQIHTKFSINRLDYGVAPDLGLELIGNKIDLDLAVTGVAFK